jgi:hypothetical protein
MERYLSFYLSYALLYFNQRIWVRDRHNFSIPAQQSVRMVERKPKSEAENFISIHQLMYSTKLAAWTLAGT